SNPVDQNQLDSWIAIHPDNTASIKAGLNFQGTGSETAVHMIAAEELGMGMDQMVFVEATTNTPNTGSHSASNTVTLAGGAIRTAAAVARQTLLGFASSQLGVAVSSLSVSGGVVSG